MTVVVLVAGLFLAASAYVVTMGFRWRDLLTMAFFFSVAFFLSRFDQMLAVSVGGRPLLGVHLYLTVAALLLLVLRGLRGHAPPRGRGRLVRLLAAWCLLSLISGAVHDGLNGLVAAFQTLVIAVPPLAVAAQFIDLYPPTLEGNRRLRLSIVLLVGVVTPLVMLMTAFQSEALGQALGWRAQATTGQTGFVRGWSPLGSTIASGGLVVMAYSIMLHEYLTTRRGIFAALAALNLIAVIFTLARSVILAFLAFHALYWLLWVRGRRIGRLLLAPLLIAAAAGGMTAVKGDYSFYRFLETDDFSLTLRWASAKSALVVSLGQPVLGAGPGLLYEEVRTSWLRQEDGGDKQRLMIVDEELTAMEPHNMYLLIAAEHGLPALLAFVGVLAAPVLAARRARGSPRFAGLASLYIAIWVSLCLLMLTDSDPLINAQFAFFFWLFGFLGMHIADTAEAAGVPSPPRGG